MYTQGYAYKICLLAIGKFPKTVSVFIQWALGPVQEWCGEHDLSVNTDKTGLVVFTRKRKLPGFFQPRLFGRALQRSMSVKYLGVILDSRLTWREYAVAKAKRAQNSLWACRRASGGAWGLDPGWFIGSMSVIRPSITFASLIWWPGS
jgi:hypothetical protein